MLSTETMDAGMTVQYFLMLWTIRSRRGRYPIVV